MKTTPNYGFVEPGQNMEITVEFDGLGLENGETLYSTLHLNSCNPDVGTLDIPLTLQVETGVNISEAESFAGKVSPNPFSESLYISFTLDNPSLVTLSIFDLNGKPVARLINNIKLDGKNSISWDGRDKSGVSVPSGIYTLGLKTNAKMSCKKLIRIQ